MPNVIGIVAPPGGSFDPADLEDAFARYFTGLKEGRFEDTDTIRLSVQTGDPQLPHMFFDLLPLMYVGAEGSFPDVEELRVEETVDGA